MEASSSSNNNGGTTTNNNNESGNNRKIECQVTSPLSMETAEKVMRRPRRWLNPTTKIALYDYKSLGYDWLIPGWICEERVMDSGRVYRYYYDPYGRLYSTKQEVLSTWEKCGLIFIDK